MSGTNPADPATCEHGATEPHFTSQGATTWCDGPVWAVQAVQGEAKLGQNSPDGVPVTASADAAHRWAGDKGAEFALKGDRYLPAGGVRHRTRPNFMESSTLIAACGISASKDYWRGTGSQDEYEHLFTIPRCSRCLSVEKR